MIRILHISDCHLNNSNLRDWKNSVKELFTKKIKEINLKKDIDFIVCTGDLIDKGGIDFGDAKTAFNTFKKELFLPILNSINLPVEKFLLVPGNHDIERTKDPERIEIGNTGWFNKDTKNISTFVNEAITKDNFSGMERIFEYKQFEKELYKQSTNSEITNFGSSFKYQINDETIGFSCLNSAWRCYSDNDTGNLLISEEQLSRSYNFIKDCSIKIALMHHPLDWLSTIERGIITEQLYKDYNLLLIGHVHENKTSIFTGLIGNIFINIAPSGLNDIRTDSRIFANGFSIIDYDKENKIIKCEYYKYNHTNKSFIINTDIANSGYFTQKIPDKIDKTKIELFASLISNIKEDHFSEMDKHMIGVKADKNIISIKDGFILPPIDKGNSLKDKEDVEIRLNITDIVKSKKNHLFFGNQEYGKTTLLFRLIREYVDEYNYLHKIPVYIDYNEIGNREINTCIKEYLRCGTEDVKYLIKSNQLVLLIDNLNYKTNGNLHLIKRVENFINENESIQLIATYTNNISGILPSDYINYCTIPFKTFFIRSLKTKEIKRLMKKWNPNDTEIKNDTKLDKLVNSFNSFALPSTAMSVSLFLWSLENKERKPINQAVLLEIYIEIILEKLATNNIYRDTFDFTNKVQLIAKIANEMLIAENPNYSILYSKFISIIENYLKNEVGFDFNAQVIADYLFERRLFVKYQNNRVKFTYLCFFHFFIAKRMEYNPDFRKYIMQENHYFLFINEINYYTGLTRSDEEFLNRIFERFEKSFKPTDFILEQINIDRHFTEFIKKEQEPIVKNLDINQVKENRPSKEFLEKIYDKQLEKIPDPNSILKKHGNISLEALLVLMSNVLRNSEGVENIKLKKLAYYSLLKYSMTWMILYRESLIKYIILHNQLPPSIPSEINIINFLKTIPYQVQLGMFNHLGTAKLSPIILEKIKEDNKNKSVSDIEKFLSVALYSDIEGSDFPKYLRSFVKKVKRNIVRDYILYKLLNYYYRRTREGSSNEQIYIDIIAELKIRTQKIPRRLKQRVIKTIEDGKRNFDKYNLR